MHYICELDNIELIRTIDDEFGRQFVFRCENDYGASVVMNRVSYGHEDGLWELGVIKFDRDEWHLDYDTPITNDVIGYLTEKDVKRLLIEISKL